LRKTLAGDVEKKTKKEGREKKGKRGRRRAEMTRREWKHVSSSGDEREERANLVKNTGISVEGKSGDGVVVHYKILCRDQERRSTATKERR